MTNGKCRSLLKVHQKYPELCIGDDKPMIFNMVILLETNGKFEHRLFTFETLNASESHDKKKTIVCYRLSVLSVNFPNDLNEADFSQD